MVVHPDIVESPDAFTWVTPPGSELHRAAYDGSVADVQLALELGGDVGEAIAIRWPDGEIVRDVTPLHLAAWNNTPEVAEALLEHGAAIDAILDDASDSFPNHPLSLAVANPNAGTLELLLSWQPDPWLIDVALIEAAKLDSVRAAQNLIDAGANINNSYVLSKVLTPGGDSHSYEWFTSVMVAAVHNSVNVAEMLLELGAKSNEENYEIWTPESSLLKIAAKYDSYEVAQLLLNQGTDANTGIRQGQEGEEPTSVGISPLHLAAENNAARTVKLLLENGADVSAVANINRLYDNTYIPDLTPLEAATLRKADPETIDLLLSHHTDPGSRTASLLHLAILDSPSTYDDEVLDVPRLLSVLELLLERGADIEERFNKDAWGVPLGGTPLHVATEIEHPDIVAFLLDRGADPRATDTHGETPCGYARHQGTFAGTPLLGRLCKP